MNSDVSGFMNGHILDHDSVVIKENPKTSLNGNERGLSVDSSKLLFFSKPNAIILENRTLP